MTFIAKPVITACAAIALVSAIGLAVAQSNDQATPGYPAASAPLNQPSNQPMNQPMTTPSRDNMQNTERSMPPSTAPRAPLTSDMQPAGDASTTSRTDLPARADRG